ncbi:hypothetical protein [Pseudomonas sp.]|uniref:hypothetical protein n=1 Tax=Pseudomonas sp. TaxID=306 RepID=UPI003D0D1D56
MQAVKEVLDTYLLPELRSLSLPAPSEVEIRDEEAVKPEKLPVIFVFLSGWRQGTGGEDATIGLDGYIRREYRFSVYVGDIAQQGRNPAETVPQILDVVCAVLEQHYTLPCSFAPDGIAADLNVLSADVSPLLRAAGSSKLMRYGRAEFSAVVVRRRQTHGGES